MTKEKEVLLTRAIGCLHVIRAEAKFIRDWKHDPKFNLESSIEKIETYGLTLHVLLGGNPPKSYEDAVVMQDFPKMCDPYVWDALTPEKNRIWLLEEWGLI